MSNKHPEDDLQKSIIQWSKLYRLPSGPDIEDRSVLFDYLFAIPNGGNRNIREAARLKAQGVKSGVHDLMLNIARGPYHGLDIELKIGKNKLSKNQVTWGVKMMKAGRMVQVCYSLDEFMVLIKEFLDQDH